ncbi:putative F-box domain, FBD domain, leucine-rich repeat domain, L domain-containing protein [Medicago truncatula]|uniref:Putative F-box domain, FBD domain, leucine-rich repeat domain, L domain-containing protein n=1 Tax=Medicago truncatula TaxID=3880 RepID=A0A396HQJ2_MEDTR|nr:putative F-box domain, FBD domain, leucine-rich repeat domain, L domain-containing protein [Medicago truncatula]
MVERRINDFPDDILTHIVSFLPFKDAFKTTVLSKKWVSLCYKLSNLEINDEGVNNAEDWIHFRRFVDAIILSPHSQNVTLKSFNLRCSSEFVDCDGFDKLVEAAKQRHVEYLDLCLLNVPLAPSIFCCDTLVVLKLARIRVGTSFNCSAHLPSLKTLVMFAVFFEDMENCFKLLSGCPKLECLDTTFIKPGFTIVEANAGVTERGYFKPLSNLINASIHIRDVPLKALYNVQYLCVTNSRLGKTISDDEIYSYYKGLPLFGNLTELQLYFRRGIHDWGEVVKMLQKCPKLQALKIVKGFDSTTKENWKYPYDVPECVLSRLTTCNIVGYEAFEHDFQFATYILQNARLLQVMTICNAKYSNPNPVPKPQYLEDLYSCPKISPACKLSII